MRQSGQIVFLCLALPLLGGCAAGAAGLALTGVSVLSSLAGGGDATRPPHLEIDPNRDLSETLAGIDHEVDPLCAARLEDWRKVKGPVTAPPPGACVAQPACLGGLRKPMQVMVCNDDPEEGGAEAGAAGRPARDRGAWTWSRATPPP